MTVVSLPAQFRIRSIDWEIDSPSQVNRSRWSGKDQVLGEPWHSRWSASLELVTIISEVNALACEAFLVELKGRVNTFRMPAVEGPQFPAFASPLVFGGVAQGATNVSVTNMPAGQNLLKGHKLTINDQMVMLMAPGTPTGPATLNFTFQPSLRQAASNGTPVEARTPTALVALAASARGWGVSPGQMYGIKLSAEERF